MIESHRKALLAAGDDPIKVIAANKEFWSRKYGFIGPNDLPMNTILFNSKTHGSYHRWDGFSMGEVYGENELNKVIPIKDYLDTPFLYDDFLAGVLKGKHTVALRKKDPKIAQTQEELNQLAKKAGKK